jgi:hypothetical protein
MGLAPLPVKLAETEPELERVYGPVPELARTWRLLTTRELRQTPRVAALFDYMVDEMDMLRSLVL